MLAVGARVQPLGRGVRRRQRRLRAIVPGPGSAVDSVRMRCRSGSLPGGLTARPGLRPARACVRLVCASRCSRGVGSDAPWIVAQARSRRFCRNAASVRCVGRSPIWSLSMLRGGFARSRSAGPVRLFRPTACSHVVRPIWVSMLALAFGAVDLRHHELRVWCRSGSVSPLSHPRSSRRRLARELVQGFDLVGPRYRLFLVSSRDGASRLQRRCSALFAVPSVSAQVRARRLVASVGGLRRRWPVRRSRAGSPVWSLHAVAWQRGRRAVVGRSAAISVRCGDRGLWFAKWSPPGFAAENGRRSIALDLVFDAPGRLRRRRGATQFREPDGRRGGGSVGRFVRDLSVLGRPCRRNRAVEMAPAVRDSAGGTFGAGSICEGAREGWGRVSDIRFAENQYRDRP